MPGISVKTTAHRGWVGYRYCEEPCRFEPPLDDTLRGLSIDLNPTIVQSFKKICNFYCKNMHFYRGEIRHIYNVK